MSNDYPRKVRDVLASQNKKTISIVLTNTGPSSDASGGQSVFDIGADDYNEQTKTLAHAQAIGVIEEGKNTYKPDIQYQQASITDNNGNPAPISDQYGDNSFIGQNAIGSGGRSMFVSLSDSDLLEINVIKGKTTPTDNSSRNYNVLLSELNITNGEQSKSELTRNIVIATRKYNSNDPDAYYNNSDDNITENESNVGKLTIQPFKGRKVLIPSYEELVNNNNNDSSTGYTITPNQFKNFGYQIPLIASGEIVIPTDVNNSEQLIGAELGVIVPGLARSGIAKINVKDMQVASVLNRISGGKFNKNTNVSNLDNSNQLSYGSYNNWIVPFADSSQLTSLPMLGIQLFTLATILWSVSSIFALKYPDSIDRQIYKENLMIGFLAFFNIQYDREINDANFFLILTETLAKINLQALGAATGGIVGNDNIVWAANDIAMYTVYLRNFFRLIGDDIASVAQSSATAVENPSINNTLNAVGSLISLFQSSNLYTIANTFSYIGVSANGRNNNISAPTNTTRFPGYASLATGGIKSQLLLSQMLIDGTKKATTEDGRKNILTELARKSPNLYTVVEQGNKIDIEQVKQLELELESQYMPFYFHDLRTNEIVSFNAFLNNMSDAFSANWESSTPYGRVEPIHQYSGTSRDLNVDFFVVSTNPADFDVMWAKVNKLITLIYPQYTKGREVRTANQSKFIQPFSQLPAASPIFRIRIGDIWKSNYSRFNVMRLFGISDPSFTIAETNNQPSSTPAPAAAPPTQSSPQAPPPTTPSSESATVPQGAQTTAGSAWRNGRTGPIVVCFIGDSQIRQPGIATGIVERLGESSIPELRGQTFQIRQAAVDGSTSSDWLRTEAAAQEQASSRSAALQANSVNANIVQWRKQTSEQIQGIEAAAIPDIVIISLGGNDNDYLSTESEERINTLISEITGTTIICQILRPCGTADGRGRRRGTLSAVVPFTERNFLRTRRATGAPLGPHLTERGITRYTAAGSTGMQHIITQVRQKIQAANGQNPASTSQQEQAPTPPPASPPPPTNPAVIQQFFNTKQDRPINAVLKTFEDNGAGGGLAVICKSLSIDWNDSRWNTEYSPSRLNYRAPLWVKIQMNMTVIHDIVPGIGNDGYMTAPIYNVGNKVNAFDRIEDGDFEKYEKRKDRAEQSLQFLVRQQETE